MIWRMAFLSSPDSISCGGSTRIPERIGSHCSISVAYFRPSSLYARRKMSSPVLPVISLMQRSISCCAWILNANRRCSLSPRDVVLGHSLEISSHPAVQNAAANFRTCSRSYCAPVSLCRAVLGIITYIKYAPVPALRRAGRSRSASLCDGGDPGAAHCPPGCRAACGPPQQTDPASRVPRAAFRRALQGFQALATDREQVLNSTPTSEHHLPYKGPLSGRQTFKQGERCAVERREAFGAASAECAREPIGH